ncbi:MAG: hypothetical protein M1823_006622, partial [Watsoniomyces obsoletus]
GCALIDAALENGVEHFVFTSVDRGGNGRSDENPTEIGHFISKHNVEKHLREKTQEGKGGMTWTILRPVAFMDNLTPGFFAKLFAVMWLGLGEETKLQLVSVTDIGMFAAKALGGFDKEEYKNQAIGLAGDEWQRYVCVESAAIGADAVTLGANVTLTSTDNEAIGLLSTVNGGFDLVVTTAGLTTFGGLVGGATALTSVLTNGGGTTAINGGGVITTGAQTYADAVTIGASAGLVSSGNAPILFGATVDGPGALTVNTGGLTRFVGEVGRTTALAALTTNGGGTTALDGGFARATGAQTFNDAVTSTNDIALDAGSVNALSLTAADDIAIRSGGLVDVDTLTSGANPDTDG